MNNNFFVRKWKKFVFRPTACVIFERPMCRHTHKNKPNSYELLSVIVKTLHPLKKALHGPMLLHSQLY